MFPAASFIWVSVLLLNFMLPPLRRCNCLPRIGIFVLLIYAEPAFGIEELTSEGNDKDMSPPWEPTIEMRLFYGTWGYRCIPAGICIMNIYFLLFIPLEPFRKGSSPIRISHYMLPPIWPGGIIWCALVAHLYWHGTGLISFNFGQLKGVWVKSVRLQLWSRRQTLRSN